MKRSTQRILTTHTGSLPRPTDVVELLLHEQKHPGAEAAKRAAEEAKEQAKKQAEIDKKHQKEIEDAQNRLRAAQLKYQSELGKQ